MMRDGNLEKFPIQRGFPEMQEFLQNREARRDIQILPDIALQQGRMVGQVVENFGGGQPIILELFVEVANTFNVHRLILTTLF